MRLGTCVAIARYWKRKRVVACWCWKSLDSSAWPQKGWLVRHNQAMLLVRLQHFQLDINRDIPSPHSSLCNAPGPLRSFTSPDCKHQAVHRNRDSWSLLECLAARHCTLRECSLERALPSFFPSSWCHPLVRGDCWYGFGAMASKRFFSAGGLLLSQFWTSSTSRLFARRYFNPCQCVLSDCDFGI